MNSPCIGKSNFVKAKCKKRGFTLIETVLALALGSLVLISMTMVTKMSLQSWTKGRVLIQRNNSVRGLLDIISRDLRYAKDSPLDVAAGENKTIVGSSNPYSKDTGNPSDIISTEIFSEGNNGKFIYDIWDLVESNNNVWKMDFTIPEVRDAEIEFEYYTKNDGKLVLLDQPLSSYQHGEKEVNGLVRAIGVNLTVDVRDGQTFKYNTLVQFRNKFKKKKGSSGGGPGFGAVM